MNRHQGTPLSPEGKRKLNKLFAELRKQSIEARQAFSCCNTCGASEMERMLILNPDRIGYAFYHAQNAASLHEEQGTYIAYGAASRSTTASSAAVIARTIVRTAHSVGLFTRWDGDVATKIYVSEVP